MSRVAGEAAATAARYGGAWHAAANRVATGYFAAPHVLCFTFERFCPIPIRVFLVLIAILAGMGPVDAAQTEPALSRFVSLRAAVANLRVGPGDQYPIAWVYQRPGLPLEVTAEFDVWRRVRDWQGEEGWIHANMLSTRRTVILVDGVQPLRKKPDGASPAIARAEPGVIARLLRCPKGSAWCRIEVKGLRGWTPRLRIWGVNQGEVYD